MLVRFVGSVAGTILLALGVASAAPYAGNWQNAEVVRFTDFDNLEVKLDGKGYKAFLVGLRPIREGKAGKEQQERDRRAVLARLQKCRLFARVVTKRGDVLGLSIDAFFDGIKCFGHPWEPWKYPYCWSGWGAYNFNTYFLYTKVTTFQNNFGENRHFKEDFVQAVKKLEEKDKKDKKKAEEGAADGGDK